MLGVGEGIRERREGFGFSVSEVARLARLPEGRVSAIEQGAPPSTAELGLLADALSFNPAQLAKGLTEDPKWSIARFRNSSPTALSSHDLRLLTRAAEAGRILASLLDTLNEAPAPLTRFRQPSAPNPALQPWQHGYELGAAAREKLSPARVRLDSVQLMLEQHGVHVAHVRFDSQDIEAASLLDLRAAPVILLNARAPKYDYVLSRRATLAHELCHLLHDGGGERDVTIVSRDTDHSPVEQRANGFAPSFLAPPKWVRLRSSKPKDIAAELANVWGLSFEGAAWHAKNLKKIDPDAAGRLKTQPGKPRIDAACEAEIPRTSPDQFGLGVEASNLVRGVVSEKVIVAFVEGGISRGRAMEILSLR